jgi:hypothetical protein
VSVIVGNNVKLRGIRSLVCTYHSEP